MFQSPCSRVYEKLPRHLQHALHVRVPCLTVHCSLLCPLQLLDGWLSEADGFGSAKQADMTSQLTLAVPGLTIPWAHAGYLWVAAAVSLSVHEVSPSAQSPLCILPLHINACSTRSQRPPH